jgi:DNA-binding CsgD family transcriptional regulator
MGDGGFSDLLERAGEAEALSAAVAASRQGHACGLLLEAPAGIGKTALLRTGAAAARGAGMTVLTARGGEFEQASAWGVVRELFTPAFRDGALTLDGAAVLAAPLFSADAMPTGDDTQASFAPIHGLYWLAVALAERAPLALIVDDLHWSDEPSLRFLAYLAARLEGLPLLLLAATRPAAGEPQSRRLLLEALATAAPVTLLRPTPLSPDASTALVRGAFDERAPDVLCTACHEMTGGNPFLLHELAGDLRADAVEPTAAAAAAVRQMTPQIVSRSVLLRLAPLLPAATALARAVAILGAHADVRRAAALAGIDMAVASSAATALLRADILEDDYGLGYRHPIVRAVVLHEIGGPERARLNGAAARLLEGDGLPPEHYASHLLAAAPTGDPWTVARLRTAAASARARGAPEIAGACLRRALDEPPDPAERGPLLLELGMLQAALDPAAGHAELREALALASGPAERQAATLALGNALTLSGAFADAAAVLEEADADAPPELVVARLAAVRWGHETQALRQLLVDRLRARVATETPAVDPRLSAAFAVETTAAGRDREAAVMHARRALAHPELLTQSANVSLMPEVVSVLVFADHYDEADTAIAALQGIGRTNGWPLSAAMAATIAAMAAYQRGAVSDAAAFAREALEDQDTIWLTTIAFAFLLAALVERGEASTARRELAARGLDGELPPTWPANVLLHHRARVHVALRDLDAAAADLRQNGELTAAWRVEEAGMMPWRSQLALLLATRGDHAEAQALAASELQAARRWGAPRAIGVALHAAGVAAGGERGQALLTEGVAVLDTSDARLEHARALVELGALLRRRGERSAARERLGQALDVAHHCGGIAIAERARQELRIAGARPRRDALRGRDALTPSELRVARMAAEGMTNRSIAQALFVTLRTVELHLTSSYAKLGIRARTELAVALLEHVGG